MKRKILIFLLSLAILIPLVTVNSPKASAVTCGGADSWAKDEAVSGISNITSATRQVRLRIQVSNGAESKVVILIKSPSESFFRPLKDAPQSFGTAESDVSDNLIEELIGRDGAAFARNANDRTFELGQYTIAIAPKGITNTEDSSQYYCILPADFLEVKPGDTGPDGFCAINYEATNTYTIKNDGTKPSVKIKVRFPGDTNQGDDNNHHHSIILVTTNRGNVPVADNDSNAPSTQELKNGWSIPARFLTEGIYRVIVKEHTGSPAGENRSCTSSPPFKIQSENEGEGGLCDGTRQCTTTVFTENASLSSPCKKSDQSASGDGCKRIKTAFGYVSTDPSNFTRWVLGFILSISGGIVVLVILVAGYKLMTSQGDPEKVKNAKDQLTAAIIGLMFIIFSLAILELITRDILGLPGFR